MPEKSKDTNFDISKSNNFIEIKGIKIKKSLLAGIFVFIFIVFYLYHNFILLNLDIGPKATDDHFIRATDFYRHYFQGVEENRLFYKNQLSQYPLLVFATTMPFFKAFGPSPWAARLSISIYIIIFLISMYAIGYELGDYFGGFSVMFLASSSPAIIQSSNTYFLDFPQTALTALSFYLLLKSNGFKNRKYSILLGIVLIFSFMAKWSMAFFLIVPILWFLIPVVFSSKKAFTAFMGLILPAVLLAGGTIYYFKIFDRLNSGFVWILYYLLFVVIPAIISFTITLLLDRKWQKEEGYLESNHRAAINFSYLSIIFTIPVFIWIFRAAYNIRMEFLPNFNMPRWIQINVRDMADFFTKMFTYAIPLMIIGFIALFLVRKKLYRNLSVPIGLIGGVLIMLKFMFPHHRYLLSLIIFAAALAGYWIGHTGKLKYLLTPVVMGISLVTILSWTFIPGHYVLYNLRILNPSYKPLEFLKTDPPDTENFKLDGVIDKLLSYRPNMPKKDVLIIYKTDTRHRSLNETFRWEIIKRGDRQKKYYNYFVNEIWDFQEEKLKSDTEQGKRLKNLLEYQPGGTNSPIFTFQEGMVYEPDSIFILYEKGKDIDYLANNLRAYYSNVRSDVTQFDVSKKYDAKIITFYWKKKKDTYIGN